MTAPITTVNKAAAIVNVDGTPTQYFFTWLRKIGGAFQGGQSVTITTYGPHTNGSQTFVNGVLTKQTPAT